MCPTPGLRAVCTVDDHDQKQNFEEGARTYQVGRSGNLHSCMHELHPDGSFSSSVRLNSKPVTFENLAYRCLKTHAWSSSRGGSRAKALAMQTLSYSLKLFITLNIMDLESKYSLYSEFSVVLAPHSSVQVHKSIDASGQHFILIQRICTVPHSLPKRHKKWDGGSKIWPLFRLKIFST
jgi:hypothetical protein